MIPQGTQKTTARKTARFGKRRNINRKKTIHTTIQNNGRTGVGLESTNTNSTQDDRGDENSKVRILGNLAVVLHEAGVDVLVVDKDGFAAD